MSFLVSEQSNGVPFTQFQMLLNTVGPRLLVVYPKTAWQCFYLYAAVYAAILSDMVAVESVRLYQTRPCTKWLIFVLVKMKSSKVKKIFVTIILDHTFLQ